MKLQFLSDLAEGDLFFTFLNQQDQETVLPFVKGVPDKNYANVLCKSPDKIPYYTITLPYNTRVWA
jgi:hypothetical protein